MLPCIFHPSTVLEPEVRISLIKQKFVFDFSLSSASPSLLLELVGKRRREVTASASRSSAISFYSSLATTNQTARRQIQNFH